MAYALVVEPKLEHSAGPLWVPPLITGKGITGDDTERGSVVR